MLVEIFFISLINACVQALDIDKLDHDGLHLGTRLCNTRQDLRIASDVIDSLPQFEFNDILNSLDYLWISVIRNFIGVIVLFFFN